MTSSAITTKIESKYRPLVSVICHSYNHGPFLAQALESFLTQKADFPLEIIIHDDASSDQSQEVIRGICKRHHDRQIIPILQKQNQFSRGVRPFRFTFPRARGKFMALCEGDDYWTSPYKLHQQVGAMRRHPDVKLSVHPAMRLSMRTCKFKKAFDHGHDERIVPPETIIARHNQFSPTASVLMCTKAAQNLPDWFFNEPGLPVADFFIEAILGREGILYLPEAMSVYRRDVPGSYTSRFRQAEGEELENALKRMLYFTEKLRGMRGIPERALDQRLSYVRLNYALQFLASGDQERFMKVTREVHLDRRRIFQLILSLMRHNQPAFKLGRLAFCSLRRYIG